MRKKDIHVLKESIKTHLIGRYFPLKPVTLNLLANDICNSKCTMCMVWKNKKGKEFTPDELGVILSDPLFSHICHIGVSGGEPTLREDISDIFRVITEKKPAVKGTSIITNAIRDDLVIERIEKTAAVCNQANIPFQLMVSLDGIGDIHDKVRGVRDSYQNSMKVIRYFKNKIPVKIGSTITSDNVWNVDELLEFCIRENIDYKFRVAEYIDRLNNRSQTEQIRNFTSGERLHLGMFFDKLLKLGKIAPKRRIVLESIRDMIGFNSPRRSKCNWQTKGVTLDCEGNLYYCAPHSPVLGNTLEQSAWKIYKSNLGTRRKLIKNHCSDCIHDYGGELSFTHWKYLESQKYWRSEFSIKNQLKKVRIGQTPVSEKKKIKKVLITGWYGSETAGDKAILASIIKKTLIEFPGSRVVLTSIKPFYSVQTVRELGFDDIKIIHTYSNDFFLELKRSDLLIMGGGPLMHINALGFVHAAFLKAKELNIFSRIESCGIGPLDSAEYFGKIVRSILLLADEITLRDSRSVEEAVKMTGRRDIRKVGDPAVDYVRDWRKKKPTVKKQNHLNLYLRDWSPEYKTVHSIEEFEELKNQFQGELAQWIKNVCRDKGLKPRLLSMHHFHHGGDDRVFNRNFAREYLSDLGPVVEKEPFSLDDILTSMTAASFSICMRFHSVLFASELGIPFHAIDYTSGGKIQAYLKDEGKLSVMVSVENVAAGKWERLVWRSSE